MDEQFSEFYATHRDRLGRALAFAVGDTALGAEAVDEAMVRAYARWSRVRTLDDPGGWVFRVGLNWATSWRRKAARRPVRPVEQLDGAHHDNYLDVDLQRALSDLPTAQRSVLVLRFLLDRSVEDTADVLGVRPGTVKSRTSRALTALRQTREART